MQINFFQITLVLLQILSGPVWAQYPNTPEGQNQAQLFQINWEPGGRKIRLSGAGIPLAELKKGKGHLKVKAFFSPNQPRELTWKLEENHVEVELPPSESKVFNLEIETRNKGQTVKETLPVQNP